MTPAAILTALALFAVAATLTYYIVDAITDRDFDE